MLYHTLYYSLFHIISIIFAIIIAVVNGNGVSVLLLFLFVCLEDNKTQKKRKRDNNIAAVAEMMYTTPVISLSPQQVLAVTQFLSSCKT